MLGSKARAQAIDLMDTLIELYTERDAVRHQQRELQERIDATSTELREILDKHPWRSTRGDDS